MNENIALGIIQSSVTAAALIFAVYTVLMPLLKDILTMRANLAVKKREEIEKRIEGDLAKADEDEITKLKELQELPWWASTGLLLTFILFLASTLIATLWFIIDKKQDPTNDTSLWVFASAISMFLLTGAGALIQIKDTLSRELEKTIQATKLKKSTIIPER